MIRLAAKDAIRQGRRPCRRLHQLGEHAEDEKQEQMQQEIHRQAVDQTRKVEKQGRQKHPPSCHCNMIWLEDRTHH